MPILIGVSLQDIVKSNVKKRKDEGCSAILVTGAGMSRQLMEPERHPNPSAEQMKMTELHEKAVSSWSGFYDLIVHQLVANAPFPKHTIIPDCATLIRENVLSLKAAHLLLYGDVVEASPKPAMQLRMWEVEDGTWDRYKESGWIDVLREAECMGDVHEQRLSNRETGIIIEDGVRFIPVPFIIQLTDSHFLLSLTSTLHILDT